MHSAALYDGRPWALHASGDRHIDALFASPPYACVDWESRFVAAMREAVAYHADRCDAFARLLDAAHFRADDLQTIADVESMPHVFVGVFKARRLTSLAAADVYVRLTSSGTTGEKSELAFDAISWNRMHVADHRVHEGMGVLAQDSACNVQLFGYDIDAAPELGPAISSYIIAYMSEFAELRPLIHDVRGSLTFDLERAVDDYERFVATGRPLRWIGYPAFMHRTAIELAKRGSARVPKPDSSWVQPAGGWKAHAATALEHGEFAGLMEKTIGVPRTHVRDLFGMAEHGVGYLECEHGRLHVPAYAHAVVRDVRTLQIVPDGVPGILHLYSPMLRSTPAISLLTTDEAVIDASACPCGRRGRGMQPLRRLGLSDYGSCALRALNYAEA